MRLKDKVFLITGAGSGIGRASALLFGREGARIVALDVDESGGRETVAQVERQGGRAVFSLCDVASESDVARSVEAGVSTFGGLDVLFNNAGVLWRDRDFEV